MDAWLIAAIALAIEGLLFLGAFLVFAMRQANLFGRLQEKIETNIDDNKKQWSRIAKIDRRMARMEGTLNMRIPHEDNGN